MRFDISPLLLDLAHTTLKVSTPDQCWIGLYTDDKNKSWKWTDGSPFDFVKWAHKQPDHAGKENCVQIFSDNSGIIIIIQG